MFPLDTSTSLLLAMAAIAGLTAAATAVRGRPAPWRTAALLITGAVWPWPIVAALYLDHVTISAAVYAGTWTVGALLAGLVWGAVARRLAGVLPIVLVALVPSLAASAFLLKRQRVPDASCAEAVDFHVGDLRLTIPRAFGLRSVEIEGAPRQDWAGYYGDDLGGKPQVRALCRATDGGTRPIDVAHVWLSFSAFRRALEAECESGTVTSSRQPVCDALARTKLTVVQFYATPDTSRLTSLGQFNPDLIAQARANGEREGFRCKNVAAASQPQYCTLWQQVTPTVLAVSSARFRPRQADDGPLADSAILLGALRDALSPE